MGRTADNPRNLLTSLILVFPLLVIYQIGVLFTLPMLNGVDFLTALLLRSVDFSRAAYLAFVAAIAVAFAVGVLLLRRRQRFNPRMVIPVLLESSIYALTMGSLIVFVMTRLFHMSPELAASLPGQGLVTRMVMSLGAGVYEELVFRLGLLSGVAAFFERVLKTRPWIAAGAALLISSFAFSAMHHLPPHGDPLSIGVFTFRLLAGAFFGLLFWFRGFAVAVYTHALYDVYVLLIR